MWAWGDEGSIQGTGRCSCWRRPQCGGRSSSRTSAPSSPWARCPPAASSNPTKKKNRIPAVHSKTKVITKSIYNGINKSRHGGTHLDTHLSCDERRLRRRAEAAATERKMGRKGLRGRELFLPVNFFPFAVFVLSPCRGAEVQMGRAGPK